jgi:hypothetical protein
VSINIAPATATASVTNNKQFALAYGGMHVFKPMEIFYQEVSNAVMGMLMIYDISCKDSPANPTFQLDNPQVYFPGNYNNNPFTQTVTQTLHRTNPQPSTLNPQPSTINHQPSTINPHCPSTQPLLSNPKTLPQTLYPKPAKPNP